MGYIMLETRKPGLSLDLSNDHLLGFEANESVGQELHTPAIRFRWIRVRLAP